MRENDLIKKALSENVTDKDLLYSKILKSATKPKRRILSFTSFKRNPLEFPRLAEKTDKTSERNSYTMKKIIIIAASIALLSITAFASVRLLTPQEVAEDMVFTDDSGVTYDHFATPFTFDDAVDINESRIDAGLKITFMGFAHGEGINVSDIEVDQNKTYAVIAIENEDGTPIEMIESMLTVSPLVKGMNPGLHNAFTFGASGMGTLIDGVQYQLMELETIEYFADNQLYLSISDGAPTIGAYLFDEQSGEITANPDHEGVNVLFNLPVDPAKADSARVDEYLARFENPEDDENSNDGNTAEGGEDYFLTMTKEDAAAMGDLVYEDVVGTNSDDAYDIYWSENNIFTTMPGEDVKTFEIGVSQLLSISGKDDTSKLLFIERTSETELKISVYEVDTDKLIS